MRRVEKAIEAFAVPQDPHADSRPKYSRDADERTHSHPIAMAALDATYDRSRYADRIRKPLLGPALSSPKSAHRLPDADRIHRAPVWPAAITCGLRHPP